MYKRKYKGFTQMWGLQGPHKSMYEISLSIYEIQ
jgi:hypothetical protein